VIRLPHHQVHVHGDLRRAGHALEDDGADGDVGHKVPVHHVKMQPVGAASLHGSDLVAQAGEILVTNDIAVSTTWTANNTYNLQDQIYVLPGATLTIEAGTVIASDTGIGGGRKSGMTSTSVPSAIADDSPAYTGAWIIPSPARHAAS